MNSPESIGAIITRCFPSLLKREQVMAADTVELKNCRCCGQPTPVNELSPSGECSDCTDQVHNG